MPCPVGRLALALALTPLWACGGDAGGDDGAGSDAAAAIDAAAAAIDSGPDVDAPPCALVEVQVGAVTPTVMLLIDRSGTMTDVDIDDGTGTGTSISRWSATYDVLMDPDTGLVAGLDDVVRFGVATYTASELNNDGVIDDGVCPRLDQVAPAIGNHAAIDAVYQPLAPLDETPTGESIALLSASLGAFAEPGPKIIVLATDGEPDRCAQPNPNGTPEAEALVLEATTAAFDAGIRTYVIGVANEPDPLHMQAVANAGVGLAEGGAAPWYQIFSVTELSAALAAIIEGVQTCTFTLDGEVNPVLAGAGSVTLDGVALEFGDQWRMLDGTTLELLGTACATAIDGDPHTVSAYFTCESIVE